MNIEEYREFCITKKAVTESFPFDQTTLVFKVAGKMFAITSLNLPFRISLKCDPDRAIELREQYTCIAPGYHLNKKLWNTITIDGTLTDDFLKELIDHSYELIVESLPKSKRP
jgi:predicted DNA-binding protein (MmcQ/YjbR family)